MSQAYTPGLKRKEVYTVTKVRRLPIPGEVLVKEGETVAYDTVVARTELPGDPFLVKADVVLDVTPQEMVECMVKHEGDRVEKGEVIAQFKAFFGLFKRECTSPVSGRIERVSEVSGQVLIRENPIPLKIDAYIPGKVVTVYPREGVEIESTCALIQGIFGVGGESHGELLRIVDDPSQEVTVDDITAECAGKVLLCGSFISVDVLRRAVEAGARGIIVGGINSKELSEFLGYKIGVAITGQEEIGLTLIVTESFGKMAMSKGTFNLLSKFEGKLCCINGATQIRAGVIRPEVIIPREDAASAAASERSEPDALAGGLRFGTPIRLIREPYIGAIGKVVDLPVDLELIETGSHVRILSVELEDGRRVTVPRANVEIIEE